MSVFVFYSRASRAEAADSLRRTLTNVGFENVQIAFSEEEHVMLPSGTRLTWAEAAEYAATFTKQVPITVQILPHGDGLDLPSYETTGAAGMDLRAAIPECVPIVLEPGKRVLVPTGFNVAIADGYEIQVRSRSGLAAKHGVCVLHGVGTIDSDYRGEIKAILINHGEEDFVIRRGDRVAQAVVASVVQGRFVVALELDETARGAGGFGSTGRA